MKPGARPVRPAATAKRAAAPLALRLVIASIPLIPWVAAHADATVPGDKTQPGNATPRPAQKPDRAVPPPPGGMPAPHVVTLPAPQPVGPPPSAPPSRKGNKK